MTSNKEYLQNANVRFLLPVCFQQFNNYLHDPCLCVFKCCVCYSRCSPLSLLFNFYLLLKYSPKTLYLHFRAIMVYLGDICLLLSSFSFAGKTQCLIGMEARRRQVSFALATHRHDGTPLTCCVRWRNAAVSAAAAGALCHASWRCSGADGAAYIPWLPSLYPF